MKKSDDWAELLASVIWQSLMHPVDDSTALACWLDLVSVFVDEQLAHLA
jgi:hypothetical protein